MKDAKKPKTTDEPKAKRQKLNAGLVCDMLGVQQGIGRRNFRAEQSLGQGERS